jgi:hypothetical protein
LGPSVAVSLATTLHVGTVYDGTNVTTWLNNSTSSSTAQTSAWATPGRINVGGPIAVGETAQAGWDGPISEVVITTSALSSTDRANLDAYFARRW